MKKVAIVFVLLVLSLIGTNVLCSQESYKIPQPEEVVEKTNVEERATTPVLEEETFPPMTEWIYNPKDKLDPFASPFMREAEEDGKLTKTDKKRKPESPIEAVDLSQLKLTAVIVAESANRAMVQDANGKGYVIYKGTYIGDKGGQVSEILKDRLLVSEEGEDDFGNVVVNKRELVLLKPY